MGGSEHLKPGDEVAGWRVEARLREGGMALLYRVVAADGTRAVLKLPKLGFGSHPACYAGFEAEQMILSRLTGPQAPRLLATGETPSGPYLVMEEVAGSPLSEQAQRAPLPADAVAKAGAALAFALHELHRQDVVHHDLKPSHVILGEDGRAALLDFGLAFHAHLPDLVEAEADQPLGTPAYLAPEQAAGGRGDPRSDIYALGVILYLLATGLLPFGQPTSRAGLHRRLYFDPPPPRRLRPDVPEWLQEIILHCLERRPEDRYASAAQVAQDLAHPEQVVLTERARRRRGTGLGSAAARWFAALTAPPPQRKPPSAHLAEAPHILVALDMEAPNEPLFQALREAVRRLIAGEGHWRLTCVTVLEPSLLTEQEEGAEIARSLQLQRLAQLHHWAQPLALPRARLRFHVLAGADAAASLIDYSRASHADHIVMGARGSSTLRRLLGSVSSRVAAEAVCSVTIVRVVKPGD